MPSLVVDEAELKGSRDGVAVDDREGGSGSDGAEV